MLLYNNADGGTNGTTPTAQPGGNTATSGNFIDTISVAGTGATLTFSNTQAAHGGLSYKFASTSTQSSYLIWRNAGATVNSLTAATTIGYARMNWFGTGFSTAARIMEYTNASISLQGGIGLTSAGKITMVNSAGTTLATSTTTLTANTWVRLETWMVASATAGQIICRIYINKDSTTPTETLTSATNINTRGGNIGAIVYGFPTSTSSTNTYYMDDVAYSSDNWLGAVEPTNFLQMF